MISVQYSKTGQSWSSLRSFREKKADIVFFPRVAASRRSKTAAAIELSYDTEELGDVN